jgi:K+/H+ antiporter YhaU regulatory subunit KhtT
MDQKTEINGIFKSDTGALINKDNDSLIAYKLRKQRENRIEENFRSIDREIEGIKQMLQKVMN